AISKGRILTLPPAGTSSGGAPVSDLAFLVRARAKVPGRRPALRWQCQDAPIPKLNRKNPCENFHDTAVLPALSLNTLNLSSGTGVPETQRSSPMSLMKSILTALVLFAAPLLLPAAERPVVAEGKTVTEAIAGAPAGQAEHGIPQKAL